jgi:hypothetical protein
MKIKPRNQIRKQQTSYTPKNATAQKQTKKQTHKQPHHQKATKQKNKRTHKQTRSEQTNNTQTELIVNSNCANIQTALSNTKYKVVSVCVCVCVTPKNATAQTKKQTNKQTNK